MKVNVAMATAKVGMMLNTKKGCFEFVFSTCLSSVRRW